ncbi:hypothetical protein AB0J74_35190 [Asanoa sp. NPDC049573]|uniref:hypothetical protein n=1 Tax=Asanoa sp. NPDC049573 TaxID=3155396 RepID=UPI0034373E84
MSDDEVLDAVRQTLSGVRMDRPIEAIEQRGRARRRKRTLLGLAAGGGAAAVAAFALALPLAAQHPAGQAAALQPAAFTLVKQSDRTVKLTLHYKQILDPAALAKALDDAGVPAVVKANVICVPKGRQLPGANQVSWTERVDWPDGSPKEYTLVIAPDRMPENSRIFFSVFAVHPDGGFAKAAHFLVSKDDPMICRPMPGTTE